MLYHSPVGLISIKSSNGFINEILFIPEEELSKNLSDDKPTEVFKRCCSQLNEYFSGTRKEFELPVKQSGTRFQEKVWDQLINIPFGKTISYLELAKRINNVKAIRAVGTANGRNNLPIIIPCHRVI
ncbi:MAG: methylated-DNA--[protein]-cysteine S-methyltransferase, partial [Ginsengibacter sp.]